MDGREILGVLKIALINARESDRVSIKCARPGGKNNMQIHTLGMPTSYQIGSPEQANTMQIR